MAEKRKTRREKIRSGEGKKSKYAQKIKQRKEDARKAGLPDNTPYPIIQAETEESN